MKAAISYVFFKVYVQFLFSSRSVKNFEKSMKSLVYLYLIKLLIIVRFSMILISEVKAINWSGFCILILFFFALELENK